MTGCHLSIIRYSPSSPHKHKYLKSESRFCSKFCVLWYKVGQIGAIKEATMTRERAS